MTLLSLGDRVESSVGDLDDELEEDTRWREITKKIKRRHQMEKMRKV